jgi:hypothetical protein
MRSMTARYNRALQQDVRTRAQLLALCVSGDLRSPGALLFG